MYSEADLEEGSETLSKADKVTQTSSITHLFLLKER